MRSNRIARSNFIKINARKPLLSVVFLFSAVSSKRFTLHFGVVFGSFLGWCLCMTLRPQDDRYLMQRAGWYYIPDRCLIKKPICLRIIVLGTLEKITNNCLEIVIETNTKMISFAELMICNIVTKGY